MIGQKIPVTKLLSEKEIQQGVLSVLALIQQSCEL